MPSSNELLEIIRIQTEIAKLGLDLGGVMSFVVQQTLSLLHADGAAIELAEGEDMVYRATAGIAKSYLGLRLKRESSLSGLSVQMNEVLNCDDSELDPRVDREACRKVGLRSMIVIPLNHKGATVGVLKVMSGQPNHFSDDDVKLLELLSELVAAAMFYSTKYDNDDLYYRATHDALTGLANRSVFMDRLRSVVSHSQRHPNPVGVLMIDMDGLKQINDTYGHRIGDAVIQEFSRRIKTSTRLSDTVARLGGDEFGVILSPIELPDGISAAVDRFNSEIEPKFTFENKDYYLKASIGAAEFPEDSNDVHGLIEMADQRMYIVKQEHHRQRSEKLH